MKSVLGGMFAIFILSIYFVINYGLKGRPEKLIDLSYADNMNSIGASVYQRLLSTFATRPTLLVFAPNTFPLWGADWVAGFSKEEQKYSSRQTVSTSPGESTDSLSSPAPSPQKIFLQYFLLPLTSTPSSLSSTNAKNISVAPPSTLGKDSVLEYRADTPRIFIVPWRLKAFMKKQPCLYKEDCFALKSFQGLRNKQKILWNKINFALEKRTQTNYFLFVYDPTAEMRSRFESE